MGLQQIKKLVYSKGNSQQIGETTYRMRRIFIDTSKTEE